MAWQLFLHSMRVNSNNLGSNYLILSAGETLSKVLTFLAFAYIARVAGPDGFGMIEFAIALIFVFSQLVDFGSEKLGAVLVSSGKDNLKGLTAHVVSLRLLLACIAFGVLVVIVVLTNKPSIAKQIILLYGVTLFLVPGLLHWIFQGLDKMHWVSVFSITRYSLFMILVFSLVKGPADIWIVGLIEILAMFVTVIMNYTIFHYNFGPLRFHIDWCSIYKILRQALPIFISQMMLAIKLHFPAIVLGFLVLHTVEVGWLRAAHKIVFALNTFVMLYFFNLLPSISRIGREDIKMVALLIGNSLKITAWTVLFIAMLGTLFAEEIIQFVYGAQFENAAIIFKIMVWLVAVFMLSGHYRYLLIGLGQQVMDMKSSVLGAIVNVVLCVVLLPKYGMLSAPIIMLFSEIISAGFAYYFVHNRIIAIPLLPHLVKPMVTSLIMFVTFSLLSKYGTLLSGLVSTVLFLLIMFLLQPKIIRDVRSFAFSKSLTVQ